MCRNIRTLHNFEPRADADEINAAALQYVRKIDHAVHEVAHITGHLLDALVTNAPPKNRDVEAAKAKARAAQRYATA
jgi:hypothetical protein